MLPRTTMFDAVLFVPAAQGQQVSVRFWAYNRIQAQLRILSELPDATLLHLSMRPRPGLDLLSPFRSDKVLSGLPAANHRGNGKTASV